MEYQPAAGVTIDPVSMRKLIESCQYAYDQIQSTLVQLNLHGRVQQEWAHDTVSLEIARYYDEQAYHGSLSNFTALNDYKNELSSTIVSLQRTLASYQITDSAAADSMDRS
jgi:hypothetical protein